MRVQKNVGAGIEGVSRIKRSEVHFEIFTIKRDGTFRSSMLIKDSGKKEVDEILFLEPLYMDMPSSDYGMNLLLTP